MSVSIPLSVPNICGNELKYINKAVESGWVSSAGPQIGEFESKLAGYVGAKSACACQSGTAGLHLCLVHYVLFCSVWLEVCLNLTVGLLQTEHLTNGKHISIL